MCVETRHGASLHCVLDKGSGLITKRIVLCGGALGAPVMFFVTNHIDHGTPNTPYKNFIFTL